MTRYKCIIWDWNGTLFDDLVICIDVMNTVLKKRNLQQLDIKRYKHIFGFPIKHYYTQLGFNFEEEPFEKISTEFIGDYQKQSLSARLNKKEVLLVGDTIHDYETACELGCDCVLLSSGHQSKERVLTLGAPVFESLLEIKNHFVF